MDTFFTYLKKTLVSTVAILFAFVVLYTPQNFVHEAEAGAAYGGSDIMTQAPQFVKDLVRTAMSIKKTVSTLYIELKEFKLDGLAWSIMKGLVIAMADDMVRWINNGFEGKPGFVQNIEEFLRDQADAAIGEYIENLEELGSFLCDPFKLDVSVALTIALDNRNQPAPSCTLTEIVDNFDDFSSGARGSFSAGGWDDWFDITTRPETNTSFGAFATAQAGALAVIADTRNEESSLLNFGNGFLSMRQCEKPEGEGATTKCSVGTPGKLIASALTNNLDSGREIMIAADEFDELMVGFLGSVSEAGVNSLFGEFIGTVNKSSTPADRELINNAASDGRANIQGQVDTEEETASSTGSTLQDDNEDAVDAERTRAEEDWERERQRIINEAVAEAEAARRAAEEEEETP